MVDGSSLFRVHGPILFSKRQELMFLVLLQRSYSEFMFTLGKLKNMPDHDGYQSNDLWNASPMLCQLSYEVSSVPQYMMCGTQSSSFNIIDNIDRLSSEISNTGSEPTAQLSGESIGLAFQIKGCRFDSHRGQAYCPVWI